MRLLKAPAAHAGRARSGVWFLAVLAIVGAIAAVEFYALSKHGRVGIAPPSAVTLPAEPIGAIDVPAAPAIAAPNVALSGWALAPGGLRTVEIRVDALRFPARFGIARPDVARLKPGYPDGENSGFEWNGDLSVHPAPPGVDRRTLTVVAIARDGREAVLGTRDVVDPAAFARWREFATQRASAFHLLPALSGIAYGGASELDSAYTAYVSPTTRAGMRVPILYLRATRGERDDYAFDPDWDVTRKCGERVITEDSLGRTLAWSRERKLPVLLTLNGGVWADAACDVPQWDVNDKLEQDPANCQWNEKNQVMPDDGLKHLPGSMDSPELGRSLTFNVYAREVRHYKKRNLQQAAAAIAAFARAHPDLLVGINLDPDVYLNPFWSETQWYDYNPGTLRQFREWLAGSGPYAGKPAPGVPDLRAWRRAQPLTLSEVGRLAGTTFTSWTDVEPPRSFPRTGTRPFWRDPWVREWEVFRRHLVALHYEELAQWLVEAGIARDRIWTSQGLMAPHGEAAPFALSLASPVKNFDSGGMTVEGAKPRHGHLGTILYGASAANDIPMENGRSLFATLAAIDPRWAVVEFNTADLRQPEVQPTYAAGYRSFRDLWNYGARFVSPMAWNGSNGVNAGKPGYVTFTAWRNTPLEEAAKDFLLARAELPLGAKLWTFGTPRHADGDGWTAETGTLTLGPGRIVLAPDAGGRVTLVGPADALQGMGAGRAVLDFAGASKPASLRVFARSSPDAAWRTIGLDANVAATAGRVVVPVDPGRAAGGMRIELQFAPGADPATLLRLAVVPR